MDTKHLHSWKEIPLQDFQNSSSEVYFKGICNILTSDATARMYVFILVVLEEQSKTCSLHLGIFLRKSNMFSEKRAFQEERIVFQQLFFRGHSLVFLGSIYQVDVSSDQLTLHVL